MARGGGEAEEVAEQRRRGGCARRPRSYVGDFKNGVIRVGLICTARSVVRYFLTGFRTEQVALCIRQLTSY